MIRMIRPFNETEILGVEIDGKAQVDMVSRILLDSFKQFKLNYSMNKSVTSLIELMRELQIVKGILKG